MPSTSPFPTAADQRLLAAIVFTDVAGFSRRVQTHEADTLKLLERDFVAMRAFSAMHSGRVIKSTGDGLLLFFTSAVQAVEWALKTQRHFADQAAELPKEEILRHRVGVHLGDVIVSAGDVMGDGVNIAARLQAEAPPGGICISQMVYGVVKNKLKLDVVRLEPRQLKNIVEPVQMYRVLLEPPAQKAATNEVFAAEPASVKKGGFAKANKGLGIAAAILVVGAAAALLYQAHREHQQELAGSQGSRDALGAAMRSETNATAKQDPVAPAVALTGEPVGPVTAKHPVLPPTGGAPEQFDFAKLAMARAPGAAPTEEEKLISQKASEALPAVEAWTVAALQRYTKDSPLAVRPLRSAGFQSSVLFTDSNRQLCFSQGGAIRKQSWPDLKPEVQGAIIASLLRYSPGAPPREIVRGAEAFAWVHRLPELADTLMREHRGH